MQNNIQLCPAIPLQEYIKACFARKPYVPPTVASLLACPQTYQTLKDLLCAMATVGALEPLAAIRPGACDIVQVYDKTIDVPPATIDATGKIVPTDGLLIELCAPMGQVMVIEHLRGLPANLTAEESGEIVRKRFTVFGFSEDACLAGQPGTGNDLGTFQNIEHIISCPEGGLDLYGRNHDPFSIARFRVHARLWTTC